MKKSKIIFLILGFVLIALVSTALTYYIIYTSNTISNDNVTVTVIINYGSLKQPDQEEYNITLLRGSSAFQAFEEVATLDFDNHTFGVYITGVNGYSEEFPDYWSFQYFDYELVEWVYSAIGVSNYYLDEGSTIKLEYTG